MVGFLDLIDADNKSRHGKGAKMCPTCTLEAVLVAVKDRWEANVLPADAEDMMIDCIHLKWPPKRKRSKKAQPTSSSNRAPPSPATKPNLEQFGLGGGGGVLGGMGGLGGGDETQPAAAFGASFPSTAGSSSSGPKSGATFTKLITPFSCEACESGKRPVLAASWVCMHSMTVPGSYPPVESIVRDLRTDVQLLTDETNDVYSIADAIHVEVKKGGGVLADTVKDRSLLRQILVDTHEDTSVLLADGGADETYYSNHSTKAQCVFRPFLMLLAHSPEMTGLPGGAAAPASGTQTLFEYMKTYLDQSGLIPPSQFPKGIGKSVASLSRLEPRVGLRQVALLVAERVLSPTSTILPNDYLTPPPPSTFDATHNGGATANTRSSSARNNLAVGTNQGNNNNPSTPSFTTMGRASVAPHVLAGRKSIAPHLASAGAGTSSVNFALLDPVQAASASADAAGGALILPPKEARLPSLLPGSPYMVRLLWDGWLSPHASPSLDFTRPSASVQLPESWLSHPDAVAAELRANTALDFPQVHWDPPFRNVRSLRTALDNSHGAMSGMSSVTGGIGAMSVMSDGQGGSLQLARTARANPPWRPTRGCL